MSALDNVHFGFSHHYKWQFPLNSDLLRVWGEFVCPQQTRQDTRYNKSYHNSQPIRRVCGRSSLWKFTALSRCEMDKYVISSNLTYILSDWYKFVILLWNTQSSQFDISCLFQGVFKIWGKLSIVAFIMALNSYKNETQMKLLNIYKTHTWDKSNHCQPWGSRNWKRNVFLKLHFWKIESPVTRLLSPSLLIRTEAKWKSKPFILWRVALHLIRTQSSFLILDITFFLFFFGYNHISFWHIVY